MPVVTLNNGRLPSRDNHLNITQVSVDDCCCEDDGRQIKEADGAVEELIVDIVVVASPSSESPVARKTTEATAEVDPHASVAIAIDSQSLEQRPLQQFSMISEGLSENSEGTTLQQTVVTAVSTTPMNGAFEVEEEFPFIDESANPSLLDTCESLRRRNMQHGVVEDASSSSDSPQIQLAVSYKCFFATNL